MADRVYASIRIGGPLAASDFIELARLVASEGLSLEQTDEPFEPDHRVLGEPLRLYAHEVAWGCFVDLEAWCVAKGLSFSRWSEGYPSQWSAERVVFTGAGDPRSYLTDEDDRVVIERGTVERLGSVEAIRAYFEAADVPVPPLVLEGEASAGPVASSIVLAHVQ